LRLVNVDFCYFLRLAAAKVRICACAS
jgi:hypothetical protein